MKEIKYKFWSGTKMFTNLANVMECLKQQVSGTYDHVGLHGAAFPQYTGLKDKNGAEIYERDILINSKSKGIVIFVKGRFVVDWFLDRDGWSETLRYQCCESEVVGNFYENPELLKD